MTATLDRLLDRVVQNANDLDAAGKAYVAFCAETQPDAAPYLNLHTKANPNNSFSTPMLYTTYKDEQESAHTKMAHTAAILTVQEISNAFHEALIDLVRLLVPPTQSYLLPNRNLVCTIDATWNDTTKPISAYFAPCGLKSTTGLKLSSTHVLGSPSNLHYIPITHKAFRTASRTLNTLPSWDGNAPKWEVGLHKNRTAYSFIIPADSQENAARIGAGLCFNTLFMPHTKGFIRPFYSPKKETLRKRDLVCAG